MKQKKLVVLLITTLALASLAGCNSKSDDNMEVKEPTQESTVPEISAEEETSEVSAEPEETVEEPKVEEIIVPDAVTASSELEPYYDSGNGSTYYYTADMANDRDLDTAWTENADGDGIGEYLEFSIPAGTEITGGLFFPGYYKNEDIYFKNNAISSIEISSGNRKVLVDTSEFANTYSEDYLEKEFTLIKPLVSDGVVRVTIMGVRNGSKYTDTCISEILFKGYPVTSTVSADSQAQTGTSVFEGIDLTRGGGAPQTDTANDTTTSTDGTAESTSATDSSTTTGYNEDGEFLGGWGDE